MALLAAADTQRGVASAHIIALDFNPAQILQHGILVNRKTPGYHGHHLTRLLLTEK
jgi:hypothetical protein